MVLETSDGYIKYLARVPVCRRWLKAPSPAHRRGQRLGNMSQ
ncbi:unnamed protein product [Tenebrio molitor]|nr:unnamed protein product [Tenebrio molitor]